MKKVLLVAINFLWSSYLYADTYGQSLKWKCTDSKSGGAVITSSPCPIGMKSEEVDSSNNIKPNGYDPKANKEYWRCTSSLESMGHGASILSEQNCLLVDPFNLMKYKGVKVNREGFTPEEAIIDAKRRQNLAQQKIWENQSNKATLQKPIINKALMTNDDLVDLRDFETVKPSKTEAKESDCRAWRSSNTIDPTPEKRKYIKENCS
jgi:hypothetical protein